MSTRCSLGLGLALVAAGAVDLSGILGLARAASAPQKIIIETQPPAPNPAPPRPVYRYDDQPIQGMPARRFLVDPKLEAAVHARFKAMTAKSKLAPLRIKMKIDLTNPPAEDKEALHIQKDIERLFGQTLRAAGVRLVNQDANILLKLMVAGRAITTPSVSGRAGSTVVVPDIAVEALRADNGDILGQVSTVEFLANDRTASQVVRICGADAIIKATALALMEDLLSMDPDQPGLATIKPPTPGTEPAETIPLSPAQSVAGNKGVPEETQPAETRPVAPGGPTPAPGKSLPNQADRGEIKTSNGSSNEVSSGYQGVDEARLRVTAEYLKDAVEHLLSSEAGK